ncbi:FUSC family protein [Paraburkholderia sp. 2C]
MDTTPVINMLATIPGAIVRELRSMTLHGPRAREATQAICSVLLAVAVATALHLDDLSWAAFSGYMVMRGDITQTLPRGLNRIAGTVGGAALGLLLAPVAADDAVLMMAILLVVSWIGVFGALKSRYSYAWVFVGITAGLILTDALSAPDTVWHFALTRVTEITVGTSSCILVACLFQRADPSDDVMTMAPPPSTPRMQRLRAVCTEEWLREHWPLIVHSTRAALAVAALPLVWRCFGVQHFAQTAVTSYALMIVPASVVRGAPNQPVYERVVHRICGCVLGSTIALGCIHLLGGDLVVEALVVSAAIWIGNHIQNGRERIGYLGTQFTLAFLITIIQGPGPVTDIDPGLERLLGIVIGSTMLGLMLTLWPASHDE